MEDDSFTTDPSEESASNRQRRGMYMHCTMHYTVYTKTASTKVHLGALQFAVLNHAQIKPRN